MAVLILGLGNTLMRDDGLGPRVVEILRERFCFPPEVELLDGGVLGLDLLPRLKGKERLLIVDTLDLGSQAGGVHRLSGLEAPGTLTGKVSVHQMGVQDLLMAAELQGHLPAELVIWGIQADTVSPGLEMSPAVEAAIPEIIAGIVQEVSDWGLAPWKRD